ncbi:MAG: hypothetical protein E6H79_13495 [Betaproteobacteria bacterium]|nr:MAG: hypothetical protein E6H79_13495 [Betaproteobacteria bacterium]
MSTDDSRDRALQAGAVGFLAKPLQSLDVVADALARLHRYVDSPARKLLVVMPDGEARRELLASFESDVEACIVERAADALAALAGADCLVIDAGCSELGPEDVLEAIELRPGAQQLPVVAWVDGDAGGSPWLQRPGGPRTPPSSCIAAWGECPTPSAARWRRCMATSAASKGARR